MALRLIICLRHVATGTGPQKQPVVAEPKGKQSATAARVSPPCSPPQLGLKHTHTTPQYHPAPYPQTHTPLPAHLPLLSKPPHAPSALHAACALPRGPTYLAVCCVHSCGMLMLLLLLLRHARWLWWSRLCRLKNVYGLILSLPHHSTGSAASSSSPPSLASLSVSHPPHQPTPAQHPRAPHTCMSPIIPPSPSTPGRAKDLLHMQTNNLLCVCVAGDQHTRVPPAPTSHMHTHARLCSSLNIRNMP